MSPITIVSGAPRFTAIGALGSVLTIAGVVGVTYVTSMDRRVTAADEVVPEV